MIDWDLQAHPRGISCKEDQCQDNPRVSTVLALNQSVTEESHNDSRGE